MTVLITGIAGFVGGHLADLLRAEDPEAQVAGLVRPGTAVPARLRQGVRIVEADLEDAAAVDAAVAAVRPDRIVHLAGQSSVHVSWTDPAGTLRTNVIGLLHLFEAVRRRRLSSSSRASASCRIAISPRLQASFATGAAAGRGVMKFLSGSGTQ